MLAATLPYLPTLDDYFVQDDFGVVGLLALKPASFFPRWFVMPWMENIWEYTPDELRPFVGGDLPGRRAVESRIAGATTRWSTSRCMRGNALLVLGIATRVAGLSTPSALVAGVAFAVLPMQTESVAWVTGRVDSMPAFFYLAAFSALLPVACRATPGALSLVARGVLCGAVLQAEHHHPGARARGIRSRHRAPAGALVVGVGAAVCPFHCC